MKATIDFATEQQAASILALEEYSRMKKELTDTLVQTHPSLHANETAVMIAAAADFVAEVNCAAKLRKIQSANLASKDMLYFYEVHQVSSVSMNSMSTIQQMDHETELQSRLYESVSIAQQYADLYVAAEKDLEAVCVQLTSLANAISTRSQRHSNNVNVTVRNPSSRLATVTSNLDAQAVRKRWSPTYFSGESDLSKYANILTGLSSTENREFQYEDGEQQLTVSSGLARTFVSTAQKSPTSSAQFKEGESQIICLQSAQAALSYSENHKTLKGEASQASNQAYSSGTFFV